MKLSNKVYDVLKWIALILLPALGALYFALAKIWGFPHATEIVGTIAAIDTFLGALLGISSHTYQGDGDFVVNTSDPDKDVYRLDIGTALGEIEKRDSITLKVKKEG